jgi:hypothetical protein
MHVECLRCGLERIVDPSEHKRLDGGECPRCKYVGWAPSEELDETLRRRVRTRPPERRRLHPA